MKRFILLAAVLLFLGSVTFAVLAAPSDSAFSWWTVDAGGAAATGGDFTFQGTIGQAESSNVSAGERFVLTGGFWSPRRVAAAFSADPTEGVRPLTVQFTNSSTGAFATCSWDFGDGIGASSDCDAPTYTYLEKGTYAVTLRIAGPGGTDTVTRPAYITVHDHTLRLPVILRP